VVRKLLRSGETEVGVQSIPVRPQSLVELYELELQAFVATLRGRKLANRSLEHEHLVQETLLRLTGEIPG
jgi:DNA-directed RNA polymerase specialized sigma24 family protein